MRLAYSALGLALGAILMHACASKPISSGSGGATGSGSGGSGSGGSGSGGSGSGGSGAGGSSVMASGGTGGGGVSATKLGSGGASGTTDAAVGSGGVGSGGSTVKPNIGGSGGSAGTGGGATAAGSGGSTALADAGTAAAGGSGGASGDAGSEGAVGCDRDLTGTWDLYTTSLTSGPVAATLVLSVDGFNYTMARGQLAYTATGTKSATYKTRSGTRSITVQNTPASVNSGSFPLALGGHWSLVSNHETCTLDVAAGTVRGTCNGRPDEFNVKADDWPYIIPSPENGRIYTFTRTSTLASQFGDFGGQWTAKSDTGSGQGCTFQLQGNTFNSACVASNDFNGITRLTISSDCVASGTTPSGLEVSGRRR